MGRYGAALEATARASASSAGPSLALALNNAVWFRLHHRTDAPADERGAWHEELREAQRILSGRPGHEKWLAYVHGTRAELFRREGNPDAALASLDAAEALDPGSADRQLIRARVLLDTSRGEAARAALESAVPGLHPDSLDGRECRALLDRIDGRARA